MTRCPICRRRDEAPCTREECAAVRAEIDADRRLDLLIEASNDY